MHTGRRSLIILSFLLSSGIAFGQANRLRSDSLIAQLLKRIHFLQVKKSGDFPAGMFPSYRAYHFNRGVLKNDDNIFFTGLIHLTLGSLKKELDPPSRKICDSIINSAAELYNRFRNQKGRATYNFWQTENPEIFPDGGWLNLFNKSQALPDDLDDTSIILMASGAPDSLVKNVHLLMQDYANGQRKHINNTLKAYRNIPAYSTWFGQKMPVDFDICVLSNILYLVNSRKLELMAADSASLQLIALMVKNRHYLDKGSTISPHYNRTPVILYHLARLMEVKKLPVLEKYKHQLVEDAMNCYAGSKSLLDNILLSTALMRWGEEPPVKTFYIKEDLISFAERENFVFFIANMAGMLPSPLNRWLGKSGIGKFYYYCPAYNLTLLVENLVLQEKGAPGERVQ